jgi:hypothetical protein
MLGLLSDLYRKFSYVVFPALSSLNVTAPLDEDHEEAVRPRQRCLARGLDDKPDPDRIIDKHESHQDRRQLAVGNIQNAI